MAPGRNSVILGKMTIIALNTNMVRQNGKTPLKTVDIEMPLSLTMPAITKILIPTGGVMFASSICMITSTPNQTRSMPAAVIIGRNMGSVRKNIDMVSIAVPNMK